MKILNYIKMKRYNFIILINLLIILFFKTGVVRGIVGGQVVKEGKFKYHASVLIDGKYVCGAAVISDDHILTAGQCVLDPNGRFLSAKIMVLSGAINLNSIGTLRKVVRIYVPYEFRPVNRAAITDPRTLETGDIAVLKLEGGYSINPNSLVAAAKIPQPYRKNLYSKFSNWNAIFTGFGVDVSFSYRNRVDLFLAPIKHNRHRQLMFSGASIDRKDRCESMYPGFQDEHLCAVLDQPRSGFSGTCLGDTGGPLIIGGNTVAGILIHFRNACDESIFSGVYTRVTSFIPFIESAKANQHTREMRVADYTGNMVERIHPSRMSDLM